MTDRKIPFTDIHTHILPGVDDGARDMEESLEMLEIAHGEGIRRIILTPHYHSEQNQYDSEKLDDLFAALRRKAAAKFPDMELYLGNEVMYSFHTVKDLRERKIHTMNGTRYVLVEYLPEVSLQAIKQSIGDLQRAGWVPVIAHIERYLCLAEKKSSIAEIKAMGAYLQMNTNSLVRKSLFDKRVKWCRRLVGNGDITFLGTDAHSASYRTPECAEAMDWLDEALDKEIRYHILYGNADKMLRDEII